MPEDLEELFQGTSTERQSDRIGQPVTRNHQPRGGGDDMAFQIDVHMLAFNDSGARERTEDETRKLALAAGFKSTKVICVVDHLAVTEFYKA